MQRRTAGTQWINKIKEYRSSNNNCTVREYVFFINILDKQVWSLYRLAAEILKTVNREKWRQRWYRLYLKSFLRSVSVPQRTRLHIFWRDCGRLWLRDTLLGCFHFKRARNTFHLVQTNLIFYMYSICLLHAFSFRVYLSKSTELFVANSTTIFKFDLISFSSKFIICIGNIFLFVFRFSFSLIVR